jgi:hypothetical protein
MAAVEVEALAVRALRQHLLASLPAQCTTVNATRAATLRAPRAGPYTLPSGAKLRVGSDPATLETVALTSGSRTAAQIAAELDAAAVAGLDASDSSGTLVLTATAAPSSTVDSMLFVGPDETPTLDCNSALGWDPGGQDVIVSAVVAPTDKGVTDGWPIDGLLDMGPGFWVVLADRSSEPRGNIRDDIHSVTVELAVLRQDPNLSRATSREHIHSCVRAVRQALLADRSLGAAVQATYELGCAISGRPLRWEDSPLMDLAELRLRIDVYERP